PGSALELAFRIRDPQSGAPVTRFETVHEKLFHLFIVSRNLDFFVHDHPVPARDGAFRFAARLPEPGMYRVLADFYPSGGTPQLTARTIFVPGAPPPAVPLAPDVAPKHGSNLDVELVTDPKEPLAGLKTMLFFRVKPADG